MWHAPPPTPFHCIFPPLFSFQAVVRPPVQKFGTHHSKFFILRYAAPAAEGEAVGVALGTRVVVVRRRGGGA